MILIARTEAIRAHQMLYFKPRYDVSGVHSRKEQLVRNPQHPAQYAPSSGSSRNVSGKLRPVAFDLVSNDCTSAINRCRSSGSAIRSTTASMAPTSSAAPSCSAAERGEAPLSGR